MIDLTKPKPASDDCPDCGQGFYDCYCVPADDLDAEQEFEDETDWLADHDLDDECDEIGDGAFRHLVTTAAGVALCVAGMLGSASHIDMSGWLIFVGAMLLL